VTNTATGSNLGFLSVTQEPGGFVGGYLVTNAWGRPLEFRISNAVQPTKVQQILYGTTLARYLCGELIGKTLIDKATTPIAAIVVNNPQSLDVRNLFNMPVGLWHPLSIAEEPMPGLLVQSRLYCHASYPEDIAALRGQLEAFGALDLGEPFARIREALSEARKMGVALRTAA